MQQAARNKTNAAKLETVLENGIAAGMTPANENDTLYQELELRGGGFAQWVVDGLAKA
jgi:hypothetical protein